jgi:hypothetical protein
VAPTDSQPVTPSAERLQFVRRPEDRFVVDSALEGNRIRTIGPAEKETAD